MYTTHDRQGRGKLFRGLVALTVLLVATVAFLVLQVRATPSWVSSGQIPSTSTAGESIAPPAGGPAPLVSSQETTVAPSEDASDTPLPAGSPMLEYQAPETGEARAKETAPAAVASLEDFIDGFWQYQDFTYDGSTLTGLSETGIAKFDTVAGKSLTLPEANPTTLQPITAIAASSFNRGFTQVDFGRMAALTTIGSNVFYSARLTSLDLSVCTQLQSIGNSAFYLSFLDSLDLSDCTQLHTIGNSAFYCSQLTSLDLSDNVALTSIGSNAFYSAPLTSLDLSTCTQLQMIGFSAFNDAQLTSLDLSNCGALQRIRSAAFYRSPLTSLDLSGLTQLQSIDGGAFFSSALTSLDLSDCVALQTIESQAFRDAPLTALDLSNCAQLKTIGFQAFASAPLTALDFSDCVQLQTIGDNAFNDAQLTSLDLSSCTDLFSLGPRSFAESPLPYITIGRISTAARSGANTNIYNNGGTIPLDTVITSHDPYLPIYILDTTGGTITSDHGYTVNPIDLTIHYVDTEGNTLRPSWVMRLSAPLVDYVLTAPSIFGYQSVAGGESKTLNIPAASVREPIEREETFVYEERDPAYYAEYAWMSLTQTTKKDFDLIGNQLLTTVRFEASSLFGASAKGTTIHLAYDPTRIDPASISVTESGIDAYTVDTSTPGLIKLLINIDNHEENVDFEPTITWRLRPGVTEEYKEFPIVGELFDEAGVAVLQANTVALSGYYNPPYFYKAANGNTADSAIQASETDLDGHFIETPSITYRPVIYYLQRNVESITYTDTLPTYTAFDGAGGTTTKVAVFDPDKNPGWVDNGDGTVSHTTARINTTSVPIVSLVLDFPDLVPETEIINAISFAAEPYRKYETESTLTGTDTITNTMFGDELPDPADDPIFEKRASGMRLHGNRLFYDMMADKTQEFRWTLVVSGTSLPEGQYYDDIEMRDDSLDDRMRYTKVELDMFDDAAVRAFDSNGAMIFEATGQNGTVTFPESIRDAIASLTVSESSTTVSRTRYAVVQVFTELRDPASVTYETCLEQGRISFENTGHLASAVIRDASGEIVGAAPVAEDSDVVYIENYSLGLGITKSLLGAKDAYQVDDEVVYGLGFNYYNLDAMDGTVPINTMYVDETLTDVEIYDVLPAHVDPTSFVPSNSLIAAATGLTHTLIGDGFTDDAGVKHDVLLIKADSLELSAILSLGTLYGRVSITAPDDSILTNFLYVDYADNPKVTKVGALTTDEDNPFGETGVLYASADIGVIATREFVAQKLIRAKNEDGTWATWQRDGVKTRGGADFQYRLLLVNNSATNRSGLTIVDALPYVGDVGIVAGSEGQRLARGSQFEDTLVSVVPPAGYDVEYLISDTPIDYAGQTADAYFAAAPWTSTFPLDSARIRAFRVTAQEGVTIDAGQSVEVLVNMKATDNATDLNKRAYNTFARKESVQTTYLESAKVYNEIYKPAQIVLQKYAGETEEVPLSGAEFGLYNAAGTLLQRKTTGVTGILSFTGIDRGTYTIRELVAPPGYERVADIAVNASDFSDGGVATAIFTAEITVHDIPIQTKGTLRLQKLDAHGEDLVGAQFRVTQVALPQSVYTKSVDASGTAVFADLPIGDYTVEEIVAPGHLTRIDTFTIAVGETGNAARGTLPAQVEHNTDTITFDITNGLASVTLYKLGIHSPDLALLDETELDIDDGVPLGGARFDLCMVAPDSTLTTVTAGATTALDGTITFGDIIVCQLYCLRETLAPDHYLPSGDVFFKVDEDGTLTDADGTPYVSGYVIVKDLPENGDDPPPEEDPPPEKEPDPDPVPETEETSETPSKQAGGAATGAAALLLPFVVMVIACVALGLQLTRERDPDKR